jgi:hypothetical protein
MVDFAQGLVQCGRGEVALRVCAKPRRAATALVDGGLAWFASDWHSSCLRYVAFRIEIAEEADNVEKDTWIRLARFRDDSHAAIVFFALPQRLPWLCAGAS